MWAYETTFYQIYPLGFCGAPRENAAPVAEDELAQAVNVAPNPDAPIMKIAKWADYMQELGVGAVLINPPLESDSHSYDTRSLRHIDRRLGGDADFAAVCDTLHAHGIRVVLDAVFNHVGRGFGPSAMCRSASGTRRTRTGSTLALTAIPAMAMAFGTRAGKAILSL